MLGLKILENIWTVDCKTRLNSHVSRRQRKSLYESLCLQVLHAASLTLLMKKAAKFSMRNNWKKLRHLKLFSRWTHNNISWFPEVPLRFVRKGKSFLKRTVSHIHPAAHLLPSEYLQLLFMFCLFLTCEQLSDLHICGLAEQSDQCRYASAVLEGDLVVVVSFAVHQVPQGSAGTAVHVCHSVVQQVHQQLNATLSPDLKREDGGRNQRDSSGTVTNNRL